MSERPVIETGTVRWEPVDWEDIVVGDRIAPLASWSLDVVAVADGNVYALNLDTGHITTFRTPLQGVHRLVRLPA
jgi:outer membrane protein assembly factor BamB